MADQNSGESLTIFLPAYNEAENLKFLLPEIKSVVHSLTPYYEIIVVDAQVPKDNTEEICNINMVRYLNRQNSNNYGDAIRTGIANSTGKFVVIMDSDGSHDPEFICRFWERRAQADVLIASRYMPGGSTKNPWMLVFMSRMLNIFFKKIVKTPVLDVSNSFRLYRGDSLRKLRLYFKHFDIVEEILAKMLWELEPSAVVIEIPFEFGERIFGKSKRNIFIFGINFFVAIFRLRRMRIKKEKKASPKPNN